MALTIEATIAYTELTGQLHPDGLLPVWHIGLGPQPLQWVSVEHYALNQFLYLQLTEGFHLPAPTSVVLRLEVTHRVRQHLSRVHPTNGSATP